MPVLGLKPPRSNKRLAEDRKGRNNGVSALFDSCLNHSVQITAQAVTGRFRCLTVVVPAFPMVSVIPAPE